VGSSVTASARSQPARTPQVTVPQARTLLRKPTRVGGLSLPSRSLTVARRAVIATFVALALALGAGPARAATVVVVTGRGWGHGVGMSQWGARGYAQHGWRWPRRVDQHTNPRPDLSRPPPSTYRPLGQANRVGRGHAAVDGHRQPESATLRDQRRTAPTRRIRRRTTTHRRLFHGRVSHTRICPDCFDTQFGRTQRGEEPATTRRPCRRGRVLMIQGEPATPPP
jgi:hypothetical protein